MCERVCVSVWVLAVTIQLGTHMQTRNKHTHNFSCVVWFYDSERLSRVCPISNVHVNKYTFHLFLCDVKNRVNERKRREKRQRWRRQQHLRRMNCCKSSSSVRLCWKRFLKSFYCFFFLMCLLFVVCFSPPIWLLWWTTHRQCQVYDVRTHQSNGSASLS